MNAVPASPPPPASGEVPGSAISVSPVVVLSRTFAARPSSLPDAHAFVRTSLSAADVEPLPHAAITEAINTALLAAAGPSDGSFVIVVRLFPDEAEVEVLSAADPAALPVEPPAAVPGTFAQWLSDVLRKQGLSQEAAARQLGVSVRTVSRWVRGQTEPRLRDVRRISDAFGPVPHH
jgi:DNA-binding NarL/FixJ family response regulator